MIDFRYHIVSLISVFLALAVGIVLGAGPLKETIGDTLTGQVSQLRDEKGALRDDLDDAKTSIDDQSDYIAAAGPELVSGALDGRRVAVVALGKVPDSTTKAIDTQLTASGAKISAEATLTSAWTDPQQASFRQALVPNLVQFLDPKPSDDASSATVLAAAIVESLTGADPAAPNSLSAGASELSQVLTSGDQPLMQLSGTVTRPADAVVVVAVPRDEPADGATPPPLPAQDEVAAELALLEAAQDQTEGAVLADGPRGDGSLTDAVLAAHDESDGLTTVSDTQDVPGQISVPLALASRIAGTNGHYGFGDGETPLPAAVQLPPVDRAPAAGKSGSGDGG